MQLEELPKKINKPKATIETLISELPDVLDVVLIDGRWGQIKTGNDPKQRETILWLDDQEPRVEEIDFNKYKLTQRINSHVDMMKGRFTPDQLQRIHWGPEEEEYPELRLQVTVFGEYSRKR